MNVDIFSSRRFAPVVALMLLACGASSPAWCKANAASLWAASTNDNTVLEFSPSELKRSGSPTPVVINSTALDAPEGVAFDKSRNLWVTQFNSNSVLEFTTAQLKNLSAVSNPVPNATIVSSVFRGPVGCTFDKDENLWIVDFSAKAVSELSSAQLNAGSNADITPAITVMSGSLIHPSFDVFDKSGNLWVASDAGVLLEFSAVQLRSSGAKTPTVILSSNGGSLDLPGEMAFDSKGNLWVSNFDNNTVVMFAKKDLSASGSPTPKVTVSSAVFNEPDGLAFDSGHNLWVANFSDGNLSKFRLKQSKASGSPTPPVLLTGVLPESFQMTFGPVF